jgi:hypothetical protein
MWKFAMTLLVAALLQSVLSVAADRPTDPHAKPSSFVPRPRSSRHVYGTPIQPAIVSHAKTSHRKHAPKKVPRTKFP